MGTKTQKLSNVVDQIVEWQSVFTGDGSTGLTAVAGRGYFIDTTSGAVTVTLPASPKVGDTIKLKDYARTWATNNVTTASTLVDGATLSNSFSTNGQTVTLVYMDGTKGWSLVNEDTTSALGALYMAATGGTVTTSGDYKIHTFTGDGCFVVSSVGNPAGSDSVDYVVVAGGGGSGYDGGGGGGAGGYREGYNPGSYCASPLATTALPVSASTYPITVGAGGPAGSPVSTPGVQGSNSVFSTITSTGGGGGSSTAPVNGGNGGSGGGSWRNPSSSGGTGNTPPVSPPQGNPGGSATEPTGGSGGGGATAAGTDGAAPTAGPGGAGATSSIDGTPTERAGGGGGGADGPACQTGGTGSGGGGNGGKRCGPSGTAGTANTGGGAGAGGAGGSAGTAGGKGIVIIRYKFQ